MHLMSLQALGEASEIAWARELSAFPDRCCQSATPVLRTAPPHPKGMVLRGISRCCRSSTWDRSRQREPRRNRRLPKILWLAARGRRPSGLDGWRGGMARRSGHSSGARQRARKRLLCKGLQVEIVQETPRFTSTIEGVRGRDPKREAGARCAQGRRAENCGNVVLTVRTVRTVRRKAGAPGRSPPCAGAGGPARPLDGSRHASAHANSARSSGNRSSIRARFSRLKAAGHQTG